MLCMLWFSRGLRLSLGSKSSKSTMGQCTWETQSRIKVPSAKENTQMRQTPSARNPYVVQLRYTSIRNRLAHFETAVKQIKTWAFWLCKHILSKSVNVRNRHWFHFQTYCAVSVLVKNMCIIFANVVKSAKRSWPFKFWGSVWFSLMLTKAAFVWSKIQ